MWIKLDITGRRRSSNITDGVGRFSSSLRVVSARGLERFNGEEGVEERRVLAFFLGDDLVLGGNERVAKRRVLRLPAPWGSKCLLSWPHIMGKTIGEEEGRCACGGRKMSACAA